MPSRLREGCLLGVSGSTAYAPLKVTVMTGGLKAQSWIIFTIFIKIATSAASDSDNGLSFQRGPLSVEAPHI